MKKLFAQKIRKLTGWIIFLAILSLFLTHFLPIIYTSVSVNGTKEDLHFNFNMIKNSDNNKIQKIAEQLELVNHSLWVIIIFAILILLVLIIQRSKQLELFNQTILFLSGFILSIFSIFSIIIFFLIFENIFGSNGIFMPDLYSFIKIPYIMLFLNVFICITAISYNYISASTYISYLKGVIDKRKIKSEESTEDISDVEFYKKDSNITDEQKIETDVGLSREALKISSDEKQKEDEINKWLSDLTSEDEPKIVEEEDQIDLTSEKQFDKTNEEEKIGSEKEPEKKTIVEEEQQIEYEEKIEPEVEISDISKENEEINLEDNQNIKEDINKKPTHKNVEPPFKHIVKGKEVFPSKNKLDKNTEGEDSKTPPPSQEFEKVLSSVLDKKAEERKKKGIYKPQEEKNKKEEKPVDNETDEKISVSCPLCKNVFYIDKNEDLAQVICPRCGKKGAIK